ncbi:MAG: ATP-binding protein [Lachnospiraceae bacterium]|nr:ATP-binding protein [Lachnospiraceae bacterium]
MNMEIDDKFQIEWNSTDSPSACTIETDRGLLKHAVTNLIQNSISHNENGCTVFLSVTADKKNCTSAWKTTGAGIANMADFLSGL